MAEQSAANRDLGEAVRLAERDHTGEALAYVGRYVRTHPSSVAGRGFLLNLLLGRSWPLPLATMRHPSALRWAEISPDGERVVTASQDGAARLWNARTGEPLFEPMKHSNVVSFAQFSPDGDHVVTASDDSTARLWDPRTGASSGGPMRHEGRVYEAQFSPDGERIATASADGTARLWDAHTGEPISEPMVSKGKGWVFTAQFSLDGERLLTASFEGPVRPFSIPVVGFARVWDVPTASARDASLLASLGEAVGGYRFDDLGALVPVDDPVARLDKLRHKVAAVPPGRASAGSLARWFLADRYTRTISPSSTVTVEEYIGQRLADGSEGALRELRRDFPSHPLIRGADTRVPHSPADK